MPQGTLVCTCHSATVGLRPEDHKFKMIQGYIARDPVSKEKKKIP